MLYARYFRITGLSEGKDIPSYLVKTRGDLPQIILMQPYGDEVRYYEELDRVEYYQELEAQKERDIQERVDWLKEYALEQGQVLEDSFLRTLVIEMRKEYDDDYE